MATKAHRRFVQRADYYNTDLELCDLLVRRFLADVDSKATLAGLLGATAVSHPYLNRRSNNKQSRLICGTHLKHTLHSAFLKDLFEDFSEFISDTMTKAALKGIDPNRFVGDIKLDIHAADFLAAGNWEAAVRLVSDAIFRKLESERSTKELLKKAAARLNLQIDPKLLSAAMPYLDARHIIVHRDGTPDEQYKRDYPTIALKDNKLVVDYAFVRSAQKAVFDLAEEIDKKVIAANLVRPQDLSGQR